MPSPIYRRSKTKPDWPRIWNFWHPCQNCAMSHFWWAIHASPFVQSRCVFVIHYESTSKLPFFIAIIESLNDNAFMRNQAVLASRSRVFQKMLYQAPSPQRKKEPPPRENKLRLFLKRSSEPLLNLQNAAQQVIKFCFNWLCCHTIFHIKWKLWMVLFNDVQKNWNIH